MGGYDTYRYRWRVGLRNGERVDTCNLHTKIVLFPDQEANV